MKRQQLGALSITAYVILALLVLLMAALGAARHFHASAERAEAARKEAAATLESERELRRITNKAGTQLAAELKKQKDRADANRRLLLDALASAPACNLPGRVGGVLRDLTKDDVAGPDAGVGGAPAQADPAAGGGARAGADAPAEAGEPVDCAAVALWAQRNIDEVLKPNAAQLSKLQALYRELQEKLNAQPAR